MLQRLARVALIIALVAVAACGAEEPDNDAATAAFIECLERNGIEARDVRVTLDEDGTVAGIEALIVSESDAKYEPAVRLGCTQEIESR